MENYKKTTDQDAIAQELTSAPPTGLRVIWREFFKDKLALFSLIFFILIILGVFIGAIVIDQDEVLRISLLDSYMPPNDDFILGTDSGGRSIFGQLIIGARNSITIGFTITALTSIVGITIGLVAGYYGGIIDNFLMRIIDFIMLLPTTMLIIVFITLVSDYNVWTFILIMSAFYWVGQARLIRSKALSESRRDYISASRTMGTPT